MAQQKEPLTAALRSQFNQQDLSNPEFERELALVADAILRALDSEGYVVAPKLKTALRRVGTRSKKTLNRVVLGNETAARRRVVQAALDAIRPHSL